MPKKDKKDKIKKRKIKSKVKTKVKTKQKQQQRQSVIVKIDQSKRIVSRRRSRKKKDTGDRGGGDPPPPPQRPITARPQQIYYDVNRQPPQAPRGGAVGGFIPPQFIYNQGAGNLGDNDRRGQDPRNDRRRNRDRVADMERQEADEKRALRGLRLVRKVKESDRKIGSLSGKVEQQAGDLQLGADILENRELEVAEAQQREERLLDEMSETRRKERIAVGVRDAYEEGYKDLVGEYQDVSETAQQANLKNIQLEEDILYEEHRADRQTRRANDAIKEVEATKRYGVAQTTAERAINTGMINVINKRSADKVNLAQAETNRAESQTSRVRAERNISQNLEGARKERTIALDNLTKVQKQFKGNRPTAVAGRLLGNTTNDKVDVYTEPTLYGARLRVYEAGRRIATLTGTSEGISTRGRPVLFSNLTHDQQANTGIKGSSGGSSSGGGGGLGRGGKAL